MKSCRSREAQTMYGTRWEGSGGEFAARGRNNKRAVCVGNTAPRWRLMVIKVNGVGGMRPGGSVGGRLPTASARIPPRRGRWNHVRRQ